MSLFGWFGPSCPVGFREKAWVETRLRWLGEQFGTERLTHGKIIVPTEECFPDGWDETPEAARRLLDWVCRYMEVPLSQISLQVQSAETTAGTFVPHEPGVVCVADTQLADPVALAARFARRLARRMLVERKLLEGDPDRELVTDLMTVLFDLGILTANATVSEKHQRLGRWSSWSVGRQSYLPSRVTAYAMALHAWLRGDENPTWGGHLRRDAAEALDQGLRYLIQTKDSLLRRDNVRSRSRNLSVHELLDRLKQGSTSARAAALWELARGDLATAESVQAVTHGLADRQAGLRAEAARTLAAWGSAAETAIPHLGEALGDSDEEVRMASAYALGKLRQQPDVVVPELIDRLNDPETIDTVAWALAQFGSAAQLVLPQLLARLKDELGRGDGSIDYLAYAVRAIAPDAEAEIERLIESCDSELQPQARELLPESGPIPDPPGGNGLWFWADLSS